MVCSRARQTNRSRERSSNPNQKVVQGQRGGRQCVPFAAGDRAGATVALHQRDARKTRSTVARFGVMGVSLFLLFGAVSGSASWGGTLHFYLFLAGLCLAMAPAIQISVGLFAEERQHQTLELLYLTGMGSGELFIGKLLGGAVVSSCELLALAPLMAVAFLCGGGAVGFFAATGGGLASVFFVLFVG